jgi:hypothetical protein
MTSSVSPHSSSSTESVPATTGKPGRLRWRAWKDGKEDEKLDLYHAGIVEDLGRGRVRILTQELQIGKLAAKLAQERPNPMVNGHQDWLDGLGKAVQESSK